MARFSSHALSLARIVFGFLMLRHGLEQASGFPEASGAARLSYEGLFELVVLPGAILVMLGLRTRPVSLALAAGYFILFVAGPLQQGPYTHRNGGDPILLNAFFLLYLAAAGGGAWSVDRWRDPRAEMAADSRWAPYALGLLRIAAGVLFLMHGLEKYFGVGGGRIDRDPLTMRGLAGLLEMVGGPLLILGLFTRPAAFILSGEMAVAYFQFHQPNGFWPVQNHGEPAVLFCFIFLYIASRGSGIWSVDAAMRRR